MKYYKDNKNNIHALEDDADEGVLPVDALRITNELADILQDRPTPYHTKKSDGTGWELTLQGEVNKAEHIRQTDINTASKTHIWGSKSLAQIQDIITKEISNMSLIKADKDILTDLLIKITNR